VIHDSADPLEVAIVNLSSLGVGLLIKNGLETDFSGITFSGTLFFDDQSFDMTIKVVYQDGAHMGCEILECASEYAVRLRDFFENEMRALNLQPVDSEYTPIEAGDEVLYREGPNNCYVLTIAAPEKLRRYKVAYFGNVFEGGEGKMFTACQIVEDRDFDKFSDGGRVEMLKAINGVSEDFKGGLIRYVSGMEFLDPKHRHIILNDMEKIKIT